MQSKGVEYLADCGPSFYVHHTPSGDPGDGRRARPHHLLSANYDTVAAQGSKFPAAASERRPQR